MQVALVVKDPPADAGDLRDMGSGWEEGMATHSSFLAWRLPLEPVCWSMSGSNCFFLTGTDFSVADKAVWYSHL